MTLTRDAKVVEEAEDTTKDVDVKEEDVSQAVLIQQATLNIAGHTDSACIQEGSVRRQRLGTRSQQQ